MRGWSRPRRGRGADRRRLAQIEVEAERAVDLGVRTGGLDAGTRKLAALKAEQAEIKARLARAPASLPSLADPKLLIEARVADFRRAFEADPETMRRGLRALPGAGAHRGAGGRREGLRGGGLAQSSPDATDARGLSGLRASATCGSGGPQHARSVFDLPVRIAS